MRIKMCAQIKLNVCKAETNTKTAYHDAVINYFTIFIKLLVPKNDLYLTQRIAVMLTYYSLHMDMLNCKTYIISNCNILGICYFRRKYFFRSKPRMRRLLFGTLLLNCFMPSKQDVQQLHFPPLLYKIGKMFPRSSISCVKMSLMCYSTKYKDT